MIRNNDLLTVTITVVPDVPPPVAHITYGPSQLHAHRGDRVQWECVNGPFVLQFLGSPPLGKVHVHSQGNAIPPIQVPAAAISGTYRFAVAVYSDGVVYIDAECPEIIIDD
jgi:hypothetical protein